MANGELNLKKLTDKELDLLRQETLAEQIRRIESDPNAYVISGESSIEEDLKILNIILAKTNVGD